METTRRWGVLGTAQITAAFIDGLRRCEGAELVAIASRDPERGAAFARRHRIPIVHPTYDALIADPGVDFVYIPLPNSLHRVWTIRALEAGKDVLCEKPLVTCADDAVQVAEAMGRTGRYAMEAFMYRHHPQWSALQDAIERGVLGDVVSIDTWFTFPLDPADVTPGSAELGGGALLDVGCYCVHLSRMLTDAEPIEVSAMQRFEGVDRSVVGLMRFPAGQLARFDCSIEQDERRGARVTGTRATAVIERPWLPSSAPAEIRIEKDGMVIDRLVAGPAHRHQLQIEAFTRAASGAEARWPISDAVNNARVIDALFEAARDGKVVSL